MNKKSIIVGILGIIVICAITTGCLFYNLLDAKEFKSHFEDLGYTIVKNEEDDVDAETSYIASKDDVEYQIKYFEFEEEVDAKKLYQHYKENLGSYITSKPQNKETTGAVFSKVVSVSEKEYIVISRVKNTLIFINATNDVSDDIDKILEDIRY